jgi:hypothetical protein
MDKQLTATTGTVQKSGNAGQWLKEAAEQPWGQPRRKSGIASWQISIAVTNLAP